MTALQQIEEAFGGTDFKGYSPRLTTQELMGATGLSYSTLAVHLRSLTRSGALKRQWTKVDHGFAYEYVRGDNWNPPHNKDEEDAASGY